MADLLGWTEQRERTFLDRYALRDRDGNLLETQPEHMWKRVAFTLARTPKEYEDFLWALEDWKFVPAGRILSGLGAGQQVTLYNCFVIAVESGDVSIGNDSRRGIMRTMERMVEITSRGGGVGVNWSTLRPAGTYIKGVNGSSSGAVQWASAADDTVDKIRQGGSRTAALMYIMNDWHPDIEEFIAFKFKRANHSIAVSEAFMDAVRADDMWPLVFPDTTHPDYNSVWDGNLETWGDRPVKVHKMIPARELWRKATEAVVKTGNPGLVFMGRAQQESNTAYFEQYIATNPCGEQFLPKNGCCNLGSINLLSLWTHDHHISDGELHHLASVATRMLDRVIDLSPDIDPEIGDLQRRVRRIGIGSMGLADVLILNGVRYGSDESLMLASHYYEVARDSAYRTSALLAEEFGPAPAYGPEFLDRPYVRRLPTEVRDLIRKHGIRNLTLTNQAPTGTTSIVAGASSGIEPIFASEYTRKDATGVSIVKHPLFRGDLGAQHVTAMEIPVHDHIAMQAAVQPMLDNAISKTINAPRGYSPDQVGVAYDLAWDEGCKGITVFVDGSLDGVLSTGVDEDEVGRLLCGDDCELPQLEYVETEAKV